MAVENDFNVFMEHIYHLRTVWLCFQQLYMTSNERVTAMYVAFPATHQAIKIALIHETVLTICRLTDPKSQGKHDNLVVDFFVDHPAIVANLAKPANAKSKEELLKLAPRLKVLSKKLHGARHKFIAHLDLEHTRDAAAVKKSLPIMRTIGHAVEWLWRIAQLLGAALDGGHRAFDETTVEAEIAWLEKCTAWGATHPRELYEFFRTQTGTSH